MSKLERLVAKNTAICFIVLSIAGMAFLGKPQFILSGLAAGAILSLAKFESYAWVFRRMAKAAANGSTLRVLPANGQTLIARFVKCPNAGHQAVTSPAAGILAFVVNQLVLLPLLFLAYHADKLLFTGFVAGVLIVPFVLMINGVAQALGIAEEFFE